MPPRIFRRSWPVCLVLLFALQQQPLHAQEIRQIDIVHVGPPAASDDMVRAQLRVKVGDQYSEYARSGLDSDTRSLYGTGLFANITTVLDPRPGGVALVYRLTGKLRLTEISFAGNEKYRAASLLKSVTSKVGQPLDEQKLFADAQALEKLYEGDGYHGTRVRYVLASDESTGRGTVTFEIAERPKVTILEVNFEGANSFPVGRLRKAISTKAHGMLSWLNGTGFMKEEEIEIDKEALSEFYQGEGYADFEVKDVQMQQTDPNHVKLRFVVSEGGRYKVGSINVRGNSVFKSEEIIRTGAGPGGLLLKSGDVFAPRKLEADTDEVRDFYRRRGYLDTDVRAVKIANTANGTIDIVFEVIGEERGPSYLEKIQIRGNTRTKDEVIRRELAVAPGEVFDYVKIQRSKSILEQMSLLAKVDVLPEPTDIPNRKDLIVEVEEADTGHLSFGAGFNSVENISGQIAFSEYNFDLMNSLRTMRVGLLRAFGSRTEEFTPPYFRGAGQKLRADIAVGTKKKEIDLTFIEPWLFGHRLTLETDLYHRYLNFFSDQYNIRQTGTRVSLAEPIFTEDLSAQLSYSIENIGILDVEATAPATIQAEEGERLVSKIGLSIAYDTRNNSLRPNHGGRTELEGNVAGGFLGGDTDFYRVEFRSSYYFPGVFEDHVIEVRGRAGAAESFGDSKGKPVSLFDRFFLGGTGSLRGYRFRDIGPAQGGEPLGGQTYWFGSVDDTIPIVERIRLAAFYDIGNVYADSFSFKRGVAQKAYSDDVGVGFRLDIPNLGPLRFDYGFPITHDKSVSGGGKFQFSVG